MLAATALASGCHTVDYTKHQSKVCEVHHLPMSKRTVPIAHGMIPMHDTTGEWTHRVANYPHPGDCEPATDIVLPGEEGKATVYVCSACEAALRRAKAGGHRE